MKTKLLEEKLFKRYLGFLDERDEYQKSVIYETLSKLNMYSFYLINILMFISLIFDTINHTFTFGTFSLLVIQQFSSYYILIKLKKTGVDITEFYDDASYTAEVKKLKKKSIIAGLEWGISMLIFMQYILPTLSGKGVQINLFIVIVWVCAGAFFGIGIYFISKQKLKKVDNN